MQRGSFWKPGELNIAEEKRGEVICQVVWDNGSWRKKGRGKRVGWASGGKGGSSLLFLSSPPEGRRERGALITVNVRHTQVKLSPEGKSSHFSLLKDYSCMESIW